MEYKGFSTMKWKDSYEAVFKIQKFNMHGAVSALIALVSCNFLHG